MIGLRLIKTFLPLLFLLYIGDVKADVRIFGTVTDDDNVPIELATVRVEGLGAGAFTNLAGKYSFRIGNRDSLVVVFSMIGYEVRKRTLYNPQDSVRLDVKLPSLDRQLDRATITARRQQTGSTQHLQVSSTKQMPSTTGNAVEELISTQAGVSSHNELSSQYHVRGGNFDENSVYLNGVEVYRPLLINSGQQEGLSIINSEMVESINFSSGGFEARYGEKMASVLDITYRKPTSWEASFAASLLGGSTYLGWGNKTFSVAASLRYKTTRYLLSSLQTTGEYNPKYLDYQTYISWRPSKAWTLDIIGNLSDNHYTFSPADRETSFGTMTNAKQFKVYFGGWESDRYRTYFGTASLTRHLGESTSLALLLSAYAAHEQETYDIQGDYWLNEATTQESLGVGTYRERARNFLTSNVQTYALRFRKQFTNSNLTSNDIHAGLSLKHEQVEEHAREWELRDSAGYSIPRHPERLSLYYTMYARTSLTSNRIEAYLQNTRRTRTDAGYFTLNYGLRLCHWDYNQETLLSPRASLSFTPANRDAITLRLACGWHYQAPGYKELRDTITHNGNTSIVLNRNIQSQRSVHFVAAADYRFEMLRRPFRFTAELYYKDLARLNPYNVNNLRLVYYGQNVAKGYATGIDFKLFGEFVPGTDSWLTFSLMSTQEKIDGHWFSRPTDQRYNLSLFFTDYFPNTDRWRMTLKAAFADGLPFGVPHSGREKMTFRAPAYKRVDLGMSYRLLNNEDHSHTQGIARYLRNVWIGVDAFNLFGLNNVSSYYWVSDVTAQQYAVPNYLTGRQLNLRVQVEL